MGVDARIKDLPSEVLSTELSALLSTMYLAVDGTSFSDAKKVKWATLITNAVVTANANNYQAMTPKAFYDSVMTNAVKGIGRLATDAEITAKSGDSYAMIPSNKQGVMQAQWAKDFFGQQNAPVYFNQSYKTAQWSAGYYADSMETFNVLYLTPDSFHVSGHVMDMVTIVLLVETTNGGEFKTFNIKRPASGTYVVNINADLDLEMAEPGRSLYVRAKRNINYVRISATVNVIMA